MPKKTEKTDINLNIEITTEDIEAAVQEYRKQYPDNEYKHRAKNKKPWYKTKNKTTGIVVNDEPYPLKYLFVLAIVTKHLHTNQIKAFLKKLKRYRIGKISKKNGKWYVDGRPL